MSKDLTGQDKKQVMKDIILKLHQGLTVEEAKNRFEQEVGNISSTEIAEIEQTLIDEGLSPEEIKKFCNVHALLFQSALQKSASEETFPSHPVFLFKLENREIEKLLNTLKDSVKPSPGVTFSTFRENVKRLLLELRGVEIHYERKEQILFPFLEKHGFPGPSKVMWGKDNEIRDLLKTALADIDSLETPEAYESYAVSALEPLIEEVNGMIFKEENILFPTCLEKLDPGEWVEILRESDDAGCVYIERPAETDILLKNLQSALFEEPVFEEENKAVVMPTGAIQLTELMPLLNTLPIDLTFVDKDDTVKYFSASKHRIFLRTKSIIGRKVQNCHPPQSLDVVEKILSSFKEGARNHNDSWLNSQGRIRYFAVRDKKGQYVGTVEVTQDITGIQELKGEKRLLDERD